MPNRLAGYLHTLSSYTIYQSREQRETISGGFFWMRSKGSLTLSHTRTLSKGRRRRNLCDWSQWVEGPVCLLYGCIRWEEAAWRKRIKRRPIPLHIEALITPQRKRERRGHRLVNPFPSFHEDDQEEVKSIDNHTAQKPVVQVMLH